MYGIHTHSVVHDIRTIKGNKKTKCDTLRLHNVDIIEPVLIKKKKQNTNTHITSRTNNAIDDNLRDIEV